MIADRFSELMFALRRVADRQRLRELSKEAVLEQQDIMYNLLEKFSPESTGSTYWDSGHDDHVPIKDGWREGVPQETPDGTSVSISNVSEHVEVQRTGTLKKNYEIWPRSTVGGTIFYPGGEQRRVRYGQGHLQFWLGPPLKWPTRVSRFAKGGYVYMTHVTHPGFGPWGGRDFVERAADEGRPALQRVVSEMGEEIFHPLEEFFR